MLNSKSLLGMPVVCEGKKLGRVSFILTDDQIRSISGLFLSCGIAGSRFIEGRDIDLIGDLAVLTHGTGKRMQLNRQPLLRRALALDGTHIGAITDVLLSESTLRIEALELSRGYVDDIARGRECVRQFIVQKNGDIVVGSTEGGNSP